MSSIQIGSDSIGKNFPCYIIAEMSCNHNQDLKTAFEIIEAAKYAGANAIKIQTYTPDTMTLPCDKPDFQIKNGGLWDGQTLYDLYKTAYTPWEWHEELVRKAQQVGITLFSSPFDITAVDFLEAYNPPAYKIASFEAVDIPLIQYIASKGKPIIMSTGMCTLKEIEEAVQTIHHSGNKEFILLKCVSAYPANPAEMNIKSIPFLRDHFDLPIGLSDHSLGNEAAIAAVALGACVLEKHFTLSRDCTGPDSAFSLEPDELKKLVQAIRYTEQTLGKGTIEPTERENKNRIFRRSLFVTQDVKKGDLINEMNIRSIRPGNGLHTRYSSEILGKPFAKDISRGTPLSWECIDMEPIPE